jgi:hypothetical protein
VRGQYDLSRQLLIRVPATATNYDRSTGRWQNSRRDPLHFYLRATICGSYRNPSAASSAFPSSAIGTSKPTKQSPLTPTKRVRTDISSIKCCTTYTAAIHNSSAVHSGRGIGATRNPNSQRRHRLLLLRLLLPILPSHRPPELIQSACTPRRGLPLEKSPRTLEVRDLLQPQSDYHLPRTTSERRQLASSVRIGAALKVTKPRRNRKTLFYGRLPGCTCLGSASLLTSAPCPACGPP